MNGLRILPIALDELLALDGGDRRRVLGGLVALARGERAGIPCSGAELPVMLYETWGFAVAYVMIGRVVWVTEVGDGSRDHGSRIQELLGMIEAVQDEVQEGMLRESLEMLTAAS